MYCVGCNSLGQTLNLIPSSNSIQEILDCVFSIPFVVYWSSGDVMYKVLCDHSAEGSSNS